MTTGDDEYREEVHKSVRKLLEDESVRLKYSKPSNVSICMVPDTLRYLHPTAYTPKIFSIGPLHREDQRLGAMEAQKVTYMHQLFHRTAGSMKKMTDKCVDAVLGLETRARACYAPSFVNHENFKFAEMMVVDGCFILELLCRSFLDTSMEGGPIFDNQLTLQEVKSDLLLLENQIPLFILEVLFNLTLKGVKCPPLIDLILYFFKDMAILHNLELGTLDEEVEHRHILGLLQSCYRPTTTNPGKIPTISFSATEIAGAGVRFKANRDESCRLAVTFKKSPLFPWLATVDMVRDASFEIPVLCIKYFTVSFLRNLIAYEQCCYPSTHHYVTSFALLMDKLIETKDDVSLLVKSKVLQHHLGACEEVTTIFNNICNGVVLHDFHYSSELKQFDDYCNRCWPTLLIFLRNLYRTTTWKTLTIIAAVVIFVLTLVQTIYTVLYV